MRAGYLRHRVTIQEQATTRNDFGEKNNTWSDLVTVDAFVKPMRGKEFIKDKIGQSEATHLVTMRYYPNITAKRHRLSYDSRILEIEALINIHERNISLELVCVEKDVTS